MRKMGYIFCLKVESGGTSQSQEKSFSENCVIALKEITRLLELGNKQEKNEERLSTHSNFYLRPWMVQQFFQIQLKAQLGPTRRSLCLSIAHSFGRGYDTQPNIVRWEKK